MAIAKRNEGAKVNSNINVTPMVDVMLVLLIIFMVITPMLQKGVSVDLAKVNNPDAMPDADKEDALLVAVMRDGNSLFRERQDSRRPADRQGERPACQPGGQASFREGGRARQVWHRWSKWWTTSAPRASTSWAC